MLTELKKSKTWLKRVDSQALIESLKNLENAFDRFFKHLSKYPRYKSKYNPVVRQDKKAILFSLLNQYNTIFWIVLLT